MPELAMMTHGEDAVARKLASEIAEKLKFNTYVPQYRESVELA